MTEFIFTEIYPNCFTQSFSCTKSKQNLIKMFARLNELMHAKHLDYEQ